MNSGDVQEFVNLMLELLCEVKSLDLDSTQLNPIPPLNPRYENPPKEYLPARLILYNIVNKIQELNSGMFAEHILAVELLYRTIVILIYQDSDERESEDMCRKKIIELLNYKSSRNVDIPIVSLQVGDEPFVFGPVTFHTMNEEDLSSEWGSRVVQYLDSHSSALSYGRVNAKGDSWIAFDTAYKQVDQGLLILKGIGFPIVAHKINQVDLIDKYRLWQNTIFRTHRPQENYRIDPTSGITTKIGPVLSKYNLDRDILSSISSENLQKIKKIAENNNGFQPVGRIEVKIFRGLSWLGEATKDDLLGARYAKITFALESLIGGESNEEKLSTRGITATLASRAAFLVSDDKEERLEVDNKVRRYYGLRSKLVHGESVEILPEDFENFGRLVRRIAWGLLKRIDQFNTVDDIQGWVKEQSYSNVED